jgi:prolipoprotein diacylglyceryltransferase
MRPVLLRIGSLSIRSYTAMLYLGIVLGVYAQLHVASLISIDQTRTLAATMLLLTAALLGARLLFVASHWSAYRGDPQRIWRFSEGGASMYGGLLLAIPLSQPLLRAVGLPFGAFWDTASFTMLIGLPITRVGCLLNGCCCGRPTSSWLGFDLPNHRGVRQRRIPVQILDAAWGLVVLTGTAALSGRAPFRGALLLYALGGYGAGRILLESLREERDRIGSLSINRALSTVFVTVSVVALAFASWR